MWTIVTVNHQGPLWIKDTNEWTINHQQTRYCQNMALCNVMWKWVKSALRQFSALTPSNALCSYHLFKMGSKPF